MSSVRIFGVAGFILLLLLTPLAVAQPGGNPPLPEIHQLIREVEAHQKALEKVRENYTFNSTQITQDIDANGQVKKTETREFEEFFVNGHQIGRLVKKDGKPLSDHDQQKETERVTKAVETAEKPQQHKPEEDLDLSVKRILEIMDVHNPRRAIYRGRSAIVFDFIGRKDAKTHGMAEDVYKKLQGTVWVDEAERQVAHIEASFDDNFHVAGGVVANVQKGSNFHVDQAPVNGEVWLQTGAEGTVQVRLFLLKGLRQHFTERDYDFKRFRVETQQQKPVSEPVRK
jgi:hypothetical protein